jgi:hypothetical protein
LGRRSGRRPTVPAAAVAGDDADFRMACQPALDGEGLAIGERVGDASPLKLADDAAVGLSARRQIKKPTFVAAVHLLGRSSATGTLAGGTATPGSDEEAIRRNPNLLDQQTSRRPRPKPSIHHGKHPPMLCLPNLAYLHRNCARTEKGPPDGGFAMASRGGHGSREGRRLIVETVAKVRRAYLPQKKAIKAICREFSTYADLQRPSASPRKNTASVIQVLGTPRQQPETLYHQESSAAS